MPALISNFFDLKNIQNIVVKLFLLFLQSIKKRSVVVKRLKHKLLAISLQPLTDENVAQIEYIRQRVRKIYRSNNTKEV